MVRARAETSAWHERLAPGGQDRHDALLMALVERESAVHLLDSLLADAARGTGRLVLVSGEAGVGKTALVTSFLGEQGHNVRVLAGACDPVVTPRPLRPLVDIAMLVGGK